MAGVAIDSKYFTKIKRFVNNTTFEDGFELENKKVRLSDIGQSHQKRGPDMGLYGKVSYWFKVINSYC